MLAAGAGGLVAGATLAGAPPRSTAPNLVWVFAEGGWDTSYSLDPKFDVPAVVGPEVDGGSNPDDVDELVSYGDLPIVVNPIRRPSIGAFFERWGSDCCLVNGVFCGAVGHPLARTRVLTGTDDEHRPDVSAIFGIETGAELPVASFGLSRWRHLGEFEPSAARIGATVQGDALVNPTGSYVPDFAQESALEAYLAERHARLRAQWGDSGGINDHRIDASLDARARGLALRDVAQSANLGLSNTPGFGERAAQAVELLASGMTRSVFLSLDGFDTHGTTSRQNELQEELFGGLGILVDELDGLGLLSNTLVVVTSEMTRTPVLNSMGGKDHWPYVTYLFLGGRTPKNRLLGGTDSRMEGVPVDLATGAATNAGTVPGHENLAAGILAHLDVDPAKWHPGVTPWGGLGL